MADSPILPGQHAWKLTPDGRLPVEFFQFLRDLIPFIRAVSGNTVDVAELEARVDALENASPEDASVQGVLSVVSQGSLANGLVQLHLQGDTAAPGSNYYYGTDATDAKGWYERLLATLADVDVTGLADGDALLWNATTEKFEPAQVDPPQIFSYITMTGEPYCTETSADLYSGVL
jgi:hypothetical protein